MSTGQLLGLDDTSSKNYQDNQAAIRKINGGRASTSSKSRHINVRYFFLIDRIAAGEMTLEYLATVDMVADLLTKPLQGVVQSRLEDSENLRSDRQIVMLTSPPG